MNDREKWRERVRDIRATSTTWWWWWWWNFYMRYICLECLFFAAFSAFSFPCMPMWLGIQVRMMLSFLERVLIFSSSLMMRGVDKSLLCRAWRTDLEFEWMMNLEDLGFAIMFMTRSIAMASDDSFGRRFNSSWFWETAVQPTFIPCLDPSV